MFNISQSATPNRREASHDAVSGDEQTNGKRWEKYEYYLNLVTGDRAILSISLDQEMWVWRLRRLLEYLV